MATRFLIVGMPGAGNLGDDLISALLVGHLYAAFPDCEIGVLTHDAQKEHLCTSQIKPDKQLYYARLNRSYRNRTQLIRDWLRDCDTVLIGGGGLFQDTHFRFTIHRYIRYAFLGGGRNCVSIAVGIGVGPIASKVGRCQLKLAAKRLSHFQVRDQRSADMLAPMARSVSLTPDIVLGSSLGEMGFPSLRSNQSFLGCSIRPWDGVNVEGITNLISAACKKGSLKARLFVFEYAPANRTELDLALQIKPRLQESGIETEVICYGKTNWLEFAEKFSNVQKAIAMRLHANVLWQKLGVSVLPISYAPKVAQLYKEHGKEAFDIADIATLTGEDREFIRLDIDRTYHLPTAHILFPQGENGKENFSLPTRMGSVLFGVADTASRIHYSIASRIRSKSK